MSPFPTGRPDPSTWSSVPTGALANPEPGVRRGRTIPAFPGLCHRGIPNGPPSGGSRTRKRFLVSHRTGAAGRRLPDSWRTACRLLRPQGRRSPGRPRGRSGGRSSARFMKEPRGSCPRSWRQPSVSSVRDEVFQIAMPSWSLGRVVLVGDASQCLSLLTAQGASMAWPVRTCWPRSLREPETTYARAVLRYERRVEPTVERVQASGRRLGRWFLPESGARLAVRNIALRAAAWPPAVRAFRRLLAVERIV